MDANIEAMSLKGHISIHQFELFQRLHESDCISFEQNTTYM